MAEIQNSVPHAVNARYYAEIVRQKAVSRQLIASYDDGYRDAYSNNFTAGELTEAAERRVFAVAQRQATGGTVPASAVVPEFLETVRRRREGEFLGLTTGLTDLDGVTCGLQPQNLIYVAGRTSMGKTSLGLKLVDHQAVTLRIPVLLVTLEMSRGEIIERLAVARSGVDGKKVRTGDLTDAEFAALERESERVASAPLFIDDTAGRSASQIASNARRHRSREGIGLLVVDLINKVEGDDPRESRREQMCGISARFKTLARELDIPVVVMAQLNRGPESRKEDGYRPRKSDLKECGNLEEDADLVILLHRPEYYDPNEQPGVAVVIVDKNRNGPTQDVKVMFRKATTGFDNLAYSAPAAPFDPADF
jgi:replicative DNA helicase